MSRNDAGVVLVHGARADGSSWAKVIGALAAEGIASVAAPPPLTFLPDALAALNRTLERVSEPVVLVGHAYAGAESDDHPADAAFLVRAHASACALSSRRSHTARHSARRRRRSHPGSAPEPVTASTRGDTP